MYFAPKHNVSYPCESGFGIYNPSQDLGKILRYFREQKHPRNIFFSVSTVRQHPLKARK